MQRSSSIIDRSTTVLSYFAHTGEAGRSVKGGGIKFIADDEKAWWLGGRRQRLQ